jgi:2-polyprenyl-3-methyl-5-hydroxy-6-metoxy-1,4-benzoquinol methylase
VGDTASAKSFANLYAKYYDVMYSDKDYAKEAKYLEALLKKHARSRVRSILDIAAGTGGHAIHLARRGYQVEAIDLSSSMIERAKVKARSEHLGIEFHVADMRRLSLGKRFDACICMFAGIDYLLSYQELGDTLSRLRAHLKPGGIFVFDFWNGAAVLTVKPSVRVKRVKVKGIELIRIAEPVLHPVQHPCDVAFYCLASRRGRIIARFDEKHTVRFYFVEELKHILQENGFKIIAFYPFLSLSGDVKIDTWNVVGVAKMSRE